MIPKTKDYYGIFLNNITKNELLGMLKNLGIKIHGVIPEDMHVTLAHIANPNAIEYIEDLLKNEKLKLSQEIPLRITAYGEYKDENGVLLNQGVRVEIPEELSKYCNNTHITISWNANRNEDGKTLSKPVNTRYCDFNKSMDKTITGYFGYFDKGVHYHLENIAKENWRNRINR